MRISCHSLFITASSSHWIMSSVRIRGLLIRVFLLVWAHDHLHTESWVLWESEDYWSECFYWFELTIIFTLNHEFCENQRIIDQSVFIGLSLFEWRLHVLMLMMNYQPGSCFIGCRLFFSSLIRIMFDQLLICEACCFCDSWADERSLTKHQIQSCSSIQTHALFISQSYFTAMILISNKQFFITRSRLTALLWCFWFLNWIIAGCVFIWAAGQRRERIVSINVFSVRLVSAAFTRTKSSTCINAFVLLLLFYL